MAGLLDGLLGSSIEDPRTQATMAMVQGLLSSPKALGGISSGLLGYGGAMQQAKQQQAAAELRKMQLEQMALQMRQQQQAADQAERDRALTQQAFTPVKGIEANAASGITGPRPAALGVVGQQPAFDPRQFIASGGSAPLAFQLQQALAKEQAKIKEFREIRMPDGSVQVVGFDEYGKPVQTGQTPFKDGDVQDFGGAKYVRDPVTNRLTLLGNKSATPDARLSASVSMRGQDMTDSRARELNAITREGQQTQVINDAERGVLFANKGTGLVRPGIGIDGKPLAGEASVKREGAAKRTLPLLDEADKLIDQATNSYLGAGIDMAGRAFGLSTGGAEATAKLKVLEGGLMLSQPRMEGPQSDKDVMLYRQMAGQIGDPTVPAPIKRAALQTIRQIQEKYAGKQPATAQPQAVPGLKFLGFEGQ